MDDDADLVLRARSGDREALAAIYDRYGDRLHDFCFTILRERHEAADAFHDAFVVAAQRLDQLREPSKLRPWLFAIARHEALRRAKARSRQQPTDEVDDVRADDTDSGGTVRQEEAAQLVWAAAAGLGERDRALLDLNLRHGLEGQELADAIGVEPSHAYVLLSRLRDQVERSLGALLVARYARRDCPELARILQGWDGRFSPLIRKRVARHADSCETCAGRRRALASPLALLGAMPLVPCPDGLRDRILGDTRLVAHQGRRWPGEGFPPSAYTSRPARGPAVLGAAAVVLLAVVGLVLLLGGGGEEPAVPVAAGPGPATTVAAGPAGPGSPVTSAGPLPADPAGAVAADTTAAPPAGTAGPPATTAAPPTAPPSATGPAELRLGTGSLAFGRATAEQRLAIANDGGLPLAWTASASPALFSVSPAAGTVAAGSSVQVVVRLDRAGAAEGPISGQVLVTSDGGDGTVTLTATVLRPPEVRAGADVDRLARTACTATGRTIASITAEVTDESAVTSVVLRWRDPAGAAGSVGLAPAGGGTHQGRLGPFRDQGTVTWWVEATDAAGATGRSPDRTLPVDTCRAAG